MGTLPGGKKPTKLTKAEPEIEDLYEAGNIATAKPRKAVLKKLSEQDMIGIQRVAASKGIPYQTLISGLIHQFVEVDLIQKA
jgi:predicted DNA binding CopG/RHH family protein